MVDPQNFTGVQTKFIHLKLHEKLLFASSKSSLTGKKPLKSTIF